MNQLRRRHERALLLLSLALTLAGCDRPENRGADAVDRDTRSAIPAQTAGGELPAPNPLRNVYFGDLHLHTSYSFDAWAAGVNTVPDDAYRYALGEEVDYLGRRVRRTVPLDFLAVTDHAEYLGVARVAADPGGPFAASPWPARIAELAGVPMGALRLFAPSAFRGTEPAIAEFARADLIDNNWRRQIAAAERYNQPGRFTTFVAFEWSPMPDGAHLHRNVIFKGPAFPAVPYSSLDSFRPEDLWAYVEAQRAQGIDAILIPHNSNLSQGRMFADQDSAGNSISHTQAETRAANERLVEITQNKGTSETRPEYAPTDEFAGFELLPPAENVDPETLRGGYIRPALARGLELQGRLGVNPFRFGFAGASDFHSGISSTEEFNFPGALGSGDDQSDPRAVLTQRNPVMGMATTVLSAGGLTGVWAEENTRASLFAALQRREVFATSGTRVRVRMFAGWDYPAGLIEQRDWLDRAYADGVPMGADLHRPPPGRTLRILLYALKDPDSGNLDRIQIVKVWYAGGDAHEAVFDAVWSGTRTPDPVTGKLPPVGDTVDPAAARYANTIGSAELRGEWTDPDFDPDTPAIYYARVLEIPTPRWPVYLAVRNGLPPPADIPATLQERAWTSPVFYMP